MKKRFLDNFGESITPGKIRTRIKKYLYKTGKYEVPYSSYSLVFFLSVAISVSIYFFFFFDSLKTANLLAFIFASFVILSAVEFAIVALTIFAFWVYYEFVIFKRTMKIEEVLPDFLEEVSINLRAGMSFDKALWNSVEEEFGVLEKEIEVVAKKVMIGKDTEQALKEFSQKYNSTLLQESMDMIIVGLKSGGDISGLIDKIVENVKSAYYLRKELIASIMSYVIFITLTAVIISPTLFALSFNLMQIIQNLGENLSTVSSSVLPINLGYKSIDPEDFIIYSKISVIIISAISSMIIADLREGSIRAGIKYLIVYIPISYLVYVAMLNLFSGIFGVLG